MSEGLLTWASVLQGWAQWGSVWPGDFTAGFVTEVMEGSLLEAPACAATLVGLLIWGQECVSHKLSIWSRLFFKSMWPKPRGVETSKLLCAVCYKNARALAVPTLLSWAAGEGG